MTDDTGSTAPEVDAADSASSTPAHGYPGAADPTPAHFRRLHPLTPILHGWAWLAGAVALSSQNLLLGGGQPSWFLAFLPVAAIVGFLAGLAGWWFTRYGIDGDALRIDSGILRRRSRRVRLDRLQAVDVVRPLAGRLLGVSELRLEVAGGSSAEAPLAYLAADDALLLRAELLARAAGIDAATPEAPERVLHEVSPRRLLGSTVLSGTFVMGVILLVALGGTFTIFGGEIAAGVLSSALPGAVMIGMALWNQFVKNFGFVIADSPDGFHIRKGLLDTKAQTVPPGRVQGIAFRQPLLWRLPGWVRVDVDVAGYGDASATDGSSSSTLLPVAPYADAVDVLRRALVGADPGGIALDPAPRRAGWLRPVGWRRLAFGANDRVIVVREGVFHRTFTVVPHAKTQSVRLSQGPVQRRLALATVHVDTTPGPVDATIRHRPQEQARRIVEDQAVRSRLARKADVPEQWMSTHHDGDGTIAASIDQNGSRRVPHHDEEQDPPRHGEPR
ncbi:MAG TPA: PH domain-containing protein [Jiangellaceae bacterium]|nr:PH domain-containing protein [Jiangellaceae bacterium]